MKRWHVRIFLVALFVVAFPFRSPAPLIYRPGEGWTYEPVGGEGKWRRSRAKDQLDVAQTSFDQKDFSTSLKAANRVVQNWPLSDYAPHAVYLVGRCYEEKKQDEKAFKQYQKLLEKYPKVDNYQEVIQRQFEICNRFLAGEWFKLWGYIPFFPSMDKTVEMYDKVVRNGPYSEVAAKAQMNIGAAREKQSRVFTDDPYIKAAKAYEVAADRYRDRPKIASEALYKAALSYNKQARTAEYDQSTAGQAINTFKDFKNYYPDDPRVKEGDEIIVSLRKEQARGNFETARFYEKNKQWKSARIYYNEVATQYPDSPLVDAALKRIAELNQRISAQEQRAQMPLTEVRRLAPSILLGTALLLGGCAGYRLGPTNGEIAKAHSIQINPFVNKTLEPRLGDYVMSSLRKNLQQDATFRIDTHDEGDIIVTGTITSYSRSDLSYVPTDVITVQNYQIMVTAQIVARERSTGRVLVDRPVRGVTTLQAGADLTSAERQVMPLLADDLARKATAALVDGTW